MTIEELKQEAKELRIEARKSIVKALSGSYRSLFRGQGVNFDTIREYTPGDDPRTVDWNVTARTGELYTKLFNEEKELPMVFLLDASPSLTGKQGGGTLWLHALKCYTLIALSAILNRDRVTTYLFTDQIEKHLQKIESEKELFKIFEELSSYTPLGRGSDLSSAIRASSTDFNRRGFSIIISDFLTTGYEKDLGALAKRHDVLAIRVYNSDLTEINYPGLITTVDPETGEKIFFWGSKKGRELYKKRVEIARNRWLRSCKRVEVGTLEIGTNQNVATELKRLFWRGRR